MNWDDKTLEPLKYLELALGYSNQCIERRSNNDPGAGANAGSRVDMTFVATDPLSELVWSPQKGLSIKCADGSFSSKNTTLLWDSGPSNLVEESSSDKATDKENLLTSLAEFVLRSEVAATDKFTVFPASDRSNHEFWAAPDNQMEEMKPQACVSLPLKEEELKKNRGESISERVKIQAAEVFGTTEKDEISHFPDELKKDVAQSEPVSGEPIDRGIVVGDGDHKLRMEVVLAPEILLQQCDASETNMHNVMSLGKGHDEPSSLVEKDGTQKTATCALGICPLEKLESIAENDLRILQPRNACCAVTKLTALESDQEVKNDSPQENEMGVKDETPAVNQSPTTSGSHKYQIKGKAKALSDGNVDERKLNEDDDNNESVESCNRDGHFSTGRKRWNFEQQLVVGSKRVRRQIHESPSSSSFAKQDSSFMNWISNMIKGFLKSNEDQGPSHPLALANHGREGEPPLLNVSMCSTKQDPGPRSMGFQSIFQSLYCPRAKAQEIVTLNASYQREGSKEHELDNKMCDVNATPIACRMVSGNIYKRFELSNQNVNEPTCGNGAGPVAAQPLDISVNFAASQELKVSNSVGHKNSCNLASENEKDGKSSHSSLGKRKTSSAGNIDSEPQSVEKTTHDIRNRGDPLSNLWITRFNPKSPGPLLKQDPCGKSITEGLDSFKGSLRLKQRFKNHLSSSDDYKILEARERSAEDPQHVQNRTTDTEGPFGFSDTKGQPDEKSMCKLNPIVPSPTFKNSEEMASVFVRRLDAVKHIMQSDTTDNAARATMTCFFCGRKGHQVQDCSEITNTQLEDLLRNNNSYNGAEELPCLCIRCLQLNHWAAACPNASLRLRQQVESGASFINKCSSSNMHFGAEKDDNPIISDDRGNRLKAAGLPAISDVGRDNVPSLNRRTIEATPGKLKSNIKLLEKDIAASSKESGPKENQIASLCNFVTRHISDVPRGVIDAIKKLQLSRTGILKWMISHQPLSHLDGFFLRLRLGKWEEGLGGTGYYVASINERQGGKRDHSSRNSKTSIAVNVGGIKCLVESQYVSNHEFLEEELMAWWSTASRGSSKMPSEEDLRLKVQEKKMLGL